MKEYLSSAKNLLKWFSVIIQVISVLTLIYILHIEITCTSFESKKNYNFNFCGSKCTFCRRLKLTFKSLFNVSNGWEEGRVEWRQAKRWKSRDSY